MSLWSRLGAVVARRGAGGGEAAASLSPSKAHAALSSFQALADPKRRRLPVDGSGHYHVDWATADEWRRMSRWHEHATSTYSQLLTRWQDLLVGEDGPIPVFASADEAWNRDAAAYVVDALDDLAHDASRTHAWPMFVRLLARSIARDGQMGLRYTPAGAVLIEADQVLGYVINELGGIVEWIIAPYDDRGRLQRAEAEYVPAELVEMPRVLIRNSQGFGVPIMYSSLGDHDGIQELWQAETDSAVAAVGPWLMLKEGQSGSALQPTMLAQGLQRRGSEGSQPQADGRRQAKGWVKTPAGGYVLAIDGGVQAEAWKPERPNLDVPVFSKQRLAVCTSVLLPYPVAFDETASLSFSNLRGIERVGEALMGSFRGNYLNRPLVRIIRGMVSRGIAKGQLKPVKEWTRVSLQWPRLEIHDRHRETQADAGELAIGTATLQDINGPRWREKMAQRANEFGYAAELAAVHNEAHPQHPITIHHFVGDPGRIAQSMALMPPADGEVGAPASTKPHETTEQEDTANV